MFSPPALPPTPADAEKAAVAKDRIECLAKSEARRPRHADESERFFESGHRTSESQARHSERVHSLDAGTFKAFVQARIEGMHRAEASPGMNGVLSPLTWRAPDQGMRLADSRAVGGPARRNRRLRGFGEPADCQLSPLGSKSSALKHHGVVTKIQYDDGRPLRYKVTQRRCAHGKQRAAKSGKRGFATTPANPCEDFCPRKDSEGSPFDLTNPKARDFSGARARWPEW